MAERPYTITTKPDILGFERVDVYQWADLQSGDTGAPLELPAYADRSVEIGGDFGLGGTVAIEGSLGGTVYHALRDPGLDPRSKTSGGLWSILEAVRWIRPHVTAGNGTTSITCWILLRKA